MSKNFVGVLLAMVSAGFICSSSAYAQEAVSGTAEAVAQTRPAKPRTMPARQALDAANKDAAAILDALQKDPALADELAKNPAGGEAMLRSRGAVRADSLAVDSDTGAGAQRTITITITIRNITIIIKI